jgi:hypothetical protein
MPSSALDLVAFENAAGLLRPSTQVLQPEFALAEYQSVRLFLTPDGRVEILGTADASGELVRRAAQELIRQVTPYGLRALGFNGTLKIRLEDGEADPLIPLLREGRLEDRLGVPPARRGIKLVYPLDDARGTLEIGPDEDDERSWTASINRHYAEPPSEAMLERAVSWLTALSDWLAELVTNLIAAPPDEENQHAA